MLPIIQIVDRESGEIVSQVFNFIDLIGSLETITVEQVEKFLYARGVLLNPNKLKDQKEIEQYKIINEGSFLNKERLDFMEGECEVLNQQMFENSEQKEIIEFDKETINYKEEILKAYRMMHDPFNTEISGAMEYEQNPAEPSKPTKTVNITPIGPVVQ
jgi:hypothetical protein